MTAREDLEALLAAQRRQRDEWARLVRAQIEARERMARLLGSR